MSEIDNSGMFPTVKIPPAPPMPPPKRNSIIACNSVVHGCYHRNNLSTCPITYPFEDYHIPYNKPMVREVKCRGCACIQVIKTETKLCEYCGTELVRDI